MRRSKLIHFGIWAGSAFLSALLIRLIVDPPEERTLPNFLRSGLHGASIAAAVFAMQQYFNRPGIWARRAPLAVEVLARTLAMALVVALTLILAQQLLYRDLEGEWLKHRAPIFFAAALVLSALFQAGFEMTRLIGPRVLRNVLIGRYLRPLREERIFLFLDLAHSTELAETMGELGFAALLRRFFFDIDGPIAATGGEVHSYVGDQVVVTWGLERGLQDARCLRCWLLIADRIASAAAEYEREFGLVPSFRAGLHAGPVVASEIGDQKRQIAYFGDTVNIAARLQQHGKAVGRGFLVSADLLRRLVLPERLEAEPLGAVQLAGRRQRLEVFALHRSGTP